mmetsp:Transcript_51599/g.160718  ORF Transcript_51599/g.160718 Transcript_51599/m.160718 type:complete len:260 (+) Transcript_51599:26-805(+)
MRCLTRCKQYLTIISHNFISCVNMNKCNALTCSLEPFCSPSCLSRNPLELDCPPEDAEDAADDDGERSRCLEDLNKDEADEADGNSCVGERAALTDFIVEAEDSGDYEANSCRVHARQGAAIDGLLTENSPERQSTEDDKNTRTEEAKPGGADPDDGVDTSLRRRESSEVRGDVEERARHSLGNSEPRQELLLRHPTLDVGVAKGSIVGVIGHFRADRLACLLRAQVFVLDHLLHQQRQDHLPSSEDDGACAIERFEPP